MLFRKLAKILRGKATPFQLWSACVLGSLIGFLPGFATAPGLLVTLLLILAMLNANLALAALTGVLAKLLSLLVMPVSFAAGRFLLEGPTEGLFRQLVNAPVFALFGFEYYATTGGLLMGLLLGLVCGYLIHRSVTGYRRKIKELESGSERFQKYSKKGWVKLLTWVLLGGAPKKVDYDQLLARKVGNPIRPIGVMFAALSILLLVILYHFAAEPIVTSALQQGLERANGATVDLAGAELNLKENRLTLRGLAMADPGALDTDLFRAEELTADLSGMQLLRKRLQLDQLVVRNGASGQPRQVPGRRVGEPLQPAEEKKPVEIPDTKTLDEYMKNARAWKERLAQVREWLEKLGGEGEQPEQAGESWRDRLEREIREKGYARVKAGHLVEDQPTFTILGLVAEDVRVAQLPEDRVDVAGKNLSTHPRLLGAAPELRIQSRSGKLAFETRLGQYAASPETNRLSLKCKELKVDEVAGQLTVGGKPPVAGGTLDVAIDGTFQLAGNVMVDLPMEVALHNTTLQLPGMQPQPVQQFVLPIGVRGPLDNPRIQIADQQLRSALVKAGVSKLKEEVSTKAEEELKKQIGDQGKGLLDSLLKKK